jgi:hypothetical protein
MCWSVRRDGSFLLHVVARLPALASIIVTEKTPAPPNLADETSSQHRLGVLFDEVF